MSTSWRQEFGGGAEVYKTLCAPALSVVGDSDISWLYCREVTEMTKAHSSGPSPPSVCWSSATNSSWYYNFLRTEHWLCWLFGLPWRKSLGARCDALSTGPSLGNVNLAVTADQTIHSRYLTLQLSDTWNSCKISRTAMSTFLPQT